MKKTELTEQQIETAKSIYKDKTKSWDERMNQLMNLFGKSERTVRRWCSSNVLSLKEKKDYIPEVEKLAKQKTHCKECTRFIITSAQNATDVNDKFWENIKAYSEYIDAEILVIPFRYRNPTTVQESKDDDWWDPCLVEHLTLNRHKINNRIEILGDVKIQPTAVSPLQGLEGMTGNYSCVVGHPRMELKTIPVLDTYNPKIMLTTGSVTKKNFSDSKAGKKGEFHFSTGFAIVEIEDKDTYYVRQVSANDKTGEFIDLFFGVKDGIVTKETSVDALIMGDVHVHSCDQRITDVTFNDICKKIKPNKLFIHDIMDSWSISHHNLKDPFLQYKMEVENSNSLQDEIDEMLDWLKNAEPYETYIVKSNHDEHVDRFLKDNDWRKLTTFKNVIPYMEYTSAILKGDANNGVIPYVINKRYPNIKCLTHNDNVIVNGYTCSMHGDIGASGSRGSMLQFSKLSTKSVVGHSHTISRVGGCASVGTSTKLRLNYNKGLSNWVNAHGIVNRLGKFQHIIFFHTKNGIKYTTL